jgi:hypothetical protein
VIFGGCDDESYIRERLAAGKPIFRYNERLYKEGQWKAISPRGLLQKYKDHTRYRKAPVYFLCAGAYVPCDLGIIHAYPEKMLRFGYFPETREYAPGEPFSRKKKGSILWAARMIETSGAGSEDGSLSEKTSGRDSFSHYDDRRRRTRGRSTQPGRRAWRDG